MSRSAWPRHRNPASQARRPGRHGPWARSRSSVARPSAAPRGCPLRPGRPARSHAAGWACSARPRSDRPARRPAPRWRPSAGHPGWPPRRAAAGYPRRRPWPCRSISTWCCARSAVPAPRPAGPCAWIRVRTAVRYPVGSRGGQGLGQPVRGRNAEVWDRAWFIPDWLGRARTRCARGRPFR